MPCRLTRSRHRPVRAASPNCYRGTGKRAAPTTAKPPDAWLHQRLPRGQAKSKISSGCSPISARLKAEIPRPSPDAYVAAGDWCFRWSRVARVTWDRLNVRGESQALVIGEFLASIPGQGLIEFAGQFPGLFDQGGDDALGVLVGDLDQYHVARETLDQRGDLAVFGAADQRRHSPPRPATLKKSIIWWIALR